MYLHSYTHTCKWIDLISFYIILLYYTSTLCIYVYTCTKGVLVILIRTKPLSAPFLYECVPWTRTTEQQEKGGWRLGDLQRQSMVASVRQGRLELSKRWSKEATGAVTSTISKGVEFGFISHPLLGSPNLLPERRVVALARRHCRNMVVLQVGGPCEVSECGCWGYEGVKKKEKRISLTFSLFSFSLFFFYLSFSLYTLSP